jgi:hypothetical protein
MLVLVMLSWIILSIISVVIFITFLSKRIRRIYLSSRKMSWFIRHSVLGGEGNYIYIPFTRMAWDTIWEHNAWGKVIIELFISTLVHLICMILAPIWISGLLLTIPQNE